MAGTSTPGEELPCAVRRDRVQNRPDTSAWRNGATGTALSPTITMFGGRHSEEDYYTTISCRCGVERTPGEWVLLNRQGLALRSADAQLGELADEAGAVGVAGDDQADHPLTEESGWPRYP
jgi:hypothetical protein